MHLLKHLTRSSYIRRVATTVARNHVSTSSSGFVEINDSEQLFYEQRGDESQHTLLCIPGALGNTQSDFSYQLDLLSDTFNVVAFDPRGYGQSKNVLRVFDAHYFHRDAADAAEVMRQLGHSSYSVLGWSDGGIAGMILAAQKPECVSNLIIWGACAYVSEEDKQLMELTRDLSNWSERMRSPLERVYGKEGLAQLWVDFLDGYCAFYDRPGGICIDELDDIVCPTFVIHGAKDALVPSSHPDYIHSRIKNSQQFVFPNGKHNLHMKYHKEFNALVRDFINGRIQSKL